MLILAKLERYLGWFAVPRLTMGLVICQVVTFCICLGVDNQPGRLPEERAAGALELVPQKVIDGEFWRLVTFLLLPPIQWALFAICFWYLFWLMGTALEGFWGNFRYTLFLFVGYLATVGAAFLTPDQPSGNAFVESSVFLAFAFLNPEFPLSFYFLITIPIKWFARITWASILLIIVVGPWELKAQAAAAVANFLLFFAKDIVEMIRNRKRHMERKANEFAAEGRKPEYYHKCLVCGITDRMNPKADFRYCSKCVGQCCYCGDHLKAHEHVRT